VLRVYLFNVTHIDYLNTETHILDASLNPAFIEVMIVKLFTVGAV